VKKMLPETGEDIKVMGFRRGKTLNLTVAVATVSGLIPDASHYESVMENVSNLIKDLAAKQSELEVVVRVNTGDIKATGSYYLTVTGTSAEAGDDGNTGRGNRANGLIAPMRQYSMEATAGKNPVNHTGKIYQVVAQRAANRIFGEVSGVREVYVRLLSRIGSPISEPQVASAALVLERGRSLGAVKGDVEGIMLEELGKISQVTEMIRRGEVTLF
jgi:S-adenosylmethionine synthetase